MFSRFRQNRGRIKDFYEEVVAEGRTVHAHLGRQDIPIRFIVGSVGRAHELDAQFRSKLRGWSERHQRIKMSMRQGKPLPPIKLFLLCDKQSPAYYVVDGHHRVALSLQLGFDTINAEVTEVKVAG